MGLVHHERENSGFHRSREAITVGGNGDEQYRTSHYCCWKGFNKSIVQ